MAEFEQTMLSQIFVHPDPKKSNWYNVIVTITDVEQKTGDNWMGWFLTVTDASNVEMRVVDFTTLYEYQVGEIWRM